jgi:uncharacterized membrane protein
MMAWPVSTMADEMSRYWDLRVQVGVLLVMHLMLVDAGVHAIHTVQVDKTWLQSS